MTSVSELEVLRQTLVFALLVTQFDGIALVVVFLTLTEGDNEFDVVALSQ